MTKEVNQLEQVLIETIQKSTKVGGEVYDGVKSVTANAIDFAQTQIPDVISQLLMWKLTEALVYVVVSILLMITSYKVTVRFWKATDGVVILLPVFVVVPSLVIFITSLLDALKIIIAPKLFLIEYAASLLK